MYVRGERKLTSAGTEHRAPGLSCHLWCTASNSSGLRTTLSLRAATNSQSLFSNVHRDKKTVQSLSKEHSFTNPHPHSPTLFVMYKLSHPIRMLQSHNPPAGLPEEFVILHHPLRCSPQLVYSILSSKLPLTTPPCATPHTTLLFR